MRCKWVPLILGTYSCIVRFASRDVATDNPNTEQPIQEKNASATRDPQRRRTNRQHKTTQRAHKTKANNVEISTSEARNARISA